MDELTNALDLIVFVAMSIDSQEEVYCIMRDTSIEDLISNRSYSTLERERISHIFYEETIRLITDFISCFSRDRREKLENRRRDWVLYR